MLHIIATIFALYVIIRLILPLRLSCRGRLALSALVVLVALKLFFFRLTFGSMLPELPYWLVISTGIVHGSLIVLIILTVARDAVQLLYTLARRCCSSFSA